MKFSLIAFTVLTLATGCSTVTPKPDWRAELRERLPVLGHRNFVVIADSAYPAQSNPGIRTIYTGRPQLEVVQAVLAAVAAAPHVSPVIYVDAELDAVPPADAPGIDTYRTELMRLVTGKTVRPLPHMDIIRRLDETAKLFNVLILKTDLTLPYTSVFIELDCGYWNAEAESRLREKLKTP